MTDENESITEKVQLIFDREFPELKNIIYIGGNLNRFKLEIIKHCLDKERVKDAIEKLDKTLKNYPLKIIAIEELKKELELE